MRLMKDTICSPASPCTHTASDKNLGVGKAVYEASPSYIKLTHPNKKEGSRTMPN